MLCMDCTSRMTMRRYVTALSAGTTNMCRFFSCTHSAQLSQRASLRQPPRVRSNLRTRHAAHRCSHARVRQVVQILLPSKLRHHLKALPLR
jgi:hypothetical protein